MIVIAYSSLAALGKFVREVIATIAIGLLIPGVKSAAH